MANISDIIFNNPADTSAAIMLANIEVVPNGFSALDFIDWWRPLLNDQKYDMAVMMQIPVPDYLFDPDKTFNYIIEKIIAVCNSRRYIHSDVSIAFRHKKEMKPTNEEHDYVNWFLKRPTTMRSVARIQIYVAFRRKEITFMKYLEFICSLYLTVYKNPALCDIKIDLFRDDKMKDVINKVWRHYHMQDIIKAMSDIKTQDIWNNTSVFQTHKNIINRLGEQHTGRTILKEVREYERTGIEQWFNKYNKRYEKIYENR